MSKPKFRVVELEEEYSLIPVSGSLIENMQELFEDFPRSGKSIDEFREEAIEELVDET